MKKICVQITCFELVDFCALIPIISSIFQRSLKEALITLWCASDETVVLETWMLSSSEMRWLIWTLVLLTLPFLQFCKAYLQFLSFPIHCFWYGPCSSLFRLFLTITSQSESSSHFASNLKFFLPLFTESWITLKYQWAMV